MNSERDLIGKQNELKERIAQLEAELNNVPDGTLRVSSCRERSTFYYILEGKRTYLKKTEREIAAALARKQYHTALLKELKREEKGISCFLRNYRPERAGKLYEDLSKARKELVQPIVLPDRMFIDAWRERLEIEKKQRPNTFPIGEAISTEKGETVRSKSEKIIADSLYRAGIPYVYETPLRLKGRVYYTDFAILRLADRSTWYWEHFGLLDQETYLNDSLDKLNAYAENGIFPGDGLVVSYESGRRPLNTGIVKKTIERYFLR